MNKVIFFFCLFLFVKPMISQNVLYAYDNCGNRIQRKLDISIGSDPNRIGDTGVSKAKEKAMHFGISVFPNPTQDKVNVVIAALKRDEKANITLTDSHGKNLKANQAARDRNEFDMSQYEPGVYFIKVVIGNETVVYKVMKL